MKGVKGKGKGLAENLILAIPFFILLGLCCIAGIGMAANVFTVPTVSVEPASTTGLCPGDVFSVNVTVDPAGKGVSAADVKIAFDAAVVECEDVSPGDLLGEHPLEGKKVIDNENGMVWYALARIGDTPVPTEKGTFAVLSFKVKEDAPVSYTHLTLPTN